VQIFLVLQKKHHPAGSLTFHRTVLSLGGPWWSPIIPQDQPSVKPPPKPPGPSLEFPAEKPPSVILSFWAGGILRMQKAAGEMGKLVHKPPATTSGKQHLKLISWSPALYLKVISNQI